MAMFTSNLAPILYPIKLGKKRQIGSNLPIVMGTSFAFAPTASAIGAASGIGVVLGGCLAGSTGSADYGSIQNLGVAFLVLAIVVLLQRFGKGLIKNAAILIGLIIGYIVALFLGKVVNKWCIATGAFVLMISGFSQNSLLFSQRFRMPYLAVQSLLFLV